MDQRVARDRRTGVRGGRKVVARESLDPEPGMPHESEPLPCAKVSYHDEDAAGVAARRHKQQPYKCFCGSWHLTSGRPS
jgi:hypothetical protein